MIQTIRKLWDRWCRFQHKPPSLALPSSWVFFRGHFLLEEPRHRPVNEIDGAQLIKCLPRARRDGVKL